jgi:hypothetical protein
MSLKSEEDWTGMQQISQIVGATLRRMQQLYVVSQKWTDAEEKRRYAFSHFVDAEKYGHSGGPLFRRLSIDNSGRWCDLIFCRSAKI